MNSPSSVCNLKVGGTDERVPREAVRPADTRPDSEPACAGEPRGTGHAKAQSKGWAILGICLLLAVAFVGLGTAGVLAHRHREEQLASIASDASNTVPTVSVVTARIAPADVDQLLPGNTLPLFETALYARTNGYLIRRLVDIGDRVQEGDLLAEIDTPEVNDQLEQLRATLAQTEANLVRDRANEEYGNLELARVRTLLKQKAVSQEEYDRQAASTKVATANVQATQATIQVNKADIRRLTDLQAFQKITAPFPGVITVRNYDTGALLIADNPANQVPMFRLARIDTLRVMVSVPQVYSTLIHPGQQARVFRREEPRREFPGTVTRIANALDPATRTMLTEVQVPNLDGALLPGMYLMVKFVTHSDTPHVIVPIAALVTRADGVRVAVLDNDHKVGYRDVKLGLDFGSEVEVTFGLDGGEQIVIRPGDTFPEGTIVQPAPYSEAMASGSAEKRDSAQKRPR